MTSLQVMGRLQAELVVEEGRAMTVDLLYFSYLHTVTNHSWFVFKQNNYLKKKKANLTDVLKEHSKDNSQPTLSYTIPPKMCQISRIKLCLTSFSGLRAPQLPSGVSSGNRGVALTAVFSAFATGDWQFSHITQKTWPCCRAPMFSEVHEYVVMLSL